MWSISYQGLTRTAAEWRLSGLRRRRSSQALDTLTFRVDGAAFDAAAPFAVGEEIRVLRNGVQWFVGRITGLIRTGSGQAESIEYQVAGPWWYLERLVYQQTWIIYGVGPAYRSHCIINTFADGTAMHTRDQIADCLTYASGKASAAYGSAPFQWDATEFPLLYIPSDEVRDITCAELVTKQLRWIPDAVCWWDYSTTPPTFHCRRRADLDQVILDLGQEITVLQLQPRNDLVVSSVVLKYERVDTVDGVTYPSVATDVAPSGASGDEFGALCATVDLQGFSVSRASATITSELFPATSDAWWSWLKRRNPWLASPLIQLLEFVSIERSVQVAEGETAPPLLPRELLEGSIADWMGKSAQSETVQIKVRLRVSTDDAEVLGDDVKLFTVNVTATNAESGTYSTTTGITVGETAPVGLAAALYEALGTVEWEGQCQLVERELTGQVNLGQRLSIAGGLADWAGMAAVVQTIDEDVDLGSTAVSVGPPQHLGPRDMVELLRVNRWRFTYTPKSLRATGVGSGGEVGLGRNNPRENADGGTTQRRKLVVRGDNGRIILDESQCAGLTLEVKEISVCVNGVEKNMLIIASDPY